jgi:GNAT superfamily N-acetyltransferase
MTDPREFEGLARETGAFKDIELEILKESISAWLERPGDPYSILELRDGKTLGGFAVVCKEAGTEYSYDLRAFCVDPRYIGKGVGERILALVAEELLRKEASAILRIETSSRKEAAIGKGLLAASGFALIGHIPDFYEAGDDFFMYAKHLRRTAAGGPEDSGKEGA